MRSATAASLLLEAGEDGASSSLGSVRTASDHLAGALARERVRYERFLPYLGTLGNNAPFIGLFGTVLGVINAFDALQAGNLSDAGGAASVMGPIAEALVATGVGLLVAIPAVVAFNVFQSRIKRSASNAELLARTMVAYVFSRERLDELAGPLRSAESE